ncbi:MAG: autotransporter-associated beta strand repeat-containing protein [Verrucomicrobiota bacterium]|nr:autotransporter-associated beta strand repeat-containing protein [Verrucomicrobiota bacterium]
MKYPCNPTTIAVPRILAGLLLSALASSTLIAQTNEWNSTTGGNWGDSTKWTLGSVPNAAGSVVLFDKNITGDQTITLNVDATVGSLTLQDTTRSNKWTIGGTNILTFDNLGAGAYLNISNANPQYTISAPVALADNLTLNTGFSGASGNSQGRFDFDGNITGNGKSITVNGRSQFMYDQAATSITDVAGINFNNASTSDVLRPITRAGGGFTLNQGLMANTVTVGGTTNSTTLGGAFAVGARGVGAVNLQQSITATDFVVKGDGLQAKYFHSNNTQGSVNPRNQVALTNTVANAFSGNTSVTGALLHLDFGNGNVTKINAAGTLTLSGATVLADDASAAAATQTVAGTTIGVGESNVEARRNNTQNITLNLGTITRNDGGTVVFRYNDTPGTIGTNSSITTANPATNGILGGWATLATNGTNAIDFAGVNVSGVISVPTYTAVTATGINDATKNANYDSGTSLTLSGAVNANSLRVRNNANGVLTMNTGTNNITLNTGGFLIDNYGNNNSANLVINGTGIIGGNTANDDLYIHQRNNRTTIANPLIGAGTGELYKSGFGMLTVTAPAQYTGGTTINGGILNVSNDQTRLSSGNLRLTNGGQLGASGTFTRGIGTGDGQVQFGVGGGGFSAQGGALTVNIGGAGATLTKDDINGNISLNNSTFSTHVVTLVNPVDVTDGVTISVGANVAPGQRMQSNNGVAYAVLQGGTTGTGNLQVYGFGQNSANPNDSGHAASGMLVPSGGLNHTGNIEVVGASLYMGDFSALANRNTALQVGGQLAGFGTLTAAVGGGNGEIQFQTGTFLRSGGFAAVGGPLVVNLGGAGAALSDPEGIALGNAFSTHTLEFQNNLSGKNFKVAGPVPVIMSGKISGAGFTVGNNSPTAGILVATNPGNDFTGTVSVTGSIYRAGSAAAYGAAGGGNNGGGGTHDLNGYNFSAENFAFNGNGQGPLSIPRLINSNTTSTASIGNFVLGGGLFGGGTYLGGPGNLDMNNITGSSDSGGTVAWRGTGTLTIKGNASAVVLTGTNQGFGMSFNGGRIVLDYATDTGNKLLFGNTGTGAPTFSLNQTAFELKGNASTAVTQSLTTANNSVANINNGASSVRATTRGQDVTFNMNALSRTNFGTVDFSTDQTAGGTAKITTDTVNNNRGILGGWATWEKTDWAVNSTNGADGAVGPLAAGSYADKADVSTWAASDHVTNNGAGYSGTTSTVNISSLRFNSANVSDISIAAGNTVTIGDTAAGPAGSVSAQTGGILVTPLVGANTSTISGGTIQTSAGNFDLAIHQYNTQGDLVINSVIAGNSNGNIVKTGDGKLILNGTNTNNATMRIYGGTVEVPAVANAGTAQPLGQDATVFMEGGSTLRYTGGDASTNKRITIGIGGATLDASGTGTLTINPNASNTTTIGGYVYNSSETRDADTSMPNLILTGSGNAIMNGAILLTSPAEATNSPDSAVVEGITQLTKDGTGEWTLNASNYWQGGTIINQGTLTLGHATDTLSNNGPVTVNTGGTLRVNALDNIGTLRLLGGSVTGSGTLTPMAVTATSGSISANLDGLLTRLDKNTSGVLSLSGNNSYAGGTFVNEGTLLVNNTVGSGTGSGAVTVASGAVLGGNGFVGGNTTVSGIVAPGNSAGTLTFAQNLTLLAGAKLQMEIGADALGTDKVVVAGNFDSSAGGLTIDFKLLGLPAMGTEFTLLDVSGTANYGTITFISSDGSYPTAWLEQSNFVISNGDLIYTAVPEPAMMATVFGALIMVATFLFRRRQNH